MQDSTRRHLDRGRRVSDFNETHASSYPAGSRAAALAAAIAEAVTTIEGAGAKQEAADRAGQQATEQKRVARATLKSRMQPISQTARGMDKLHPGIADLFRMPQGNNDQLTLNTARAFITEGTPRAAEFTGRGLPATFLTDLQAAIDGMIAAIDAQDEARAEQVSATAALKAAQAQLTDAVNELSPIVRNIFRDDPATLAEWESASQLERAPRRATTPPPPPPPPNP